MSLLPTYLYFRFESTAMNYLTPDDEAQNMGLLFGALDSKVKLSAFGYQGDIVKQVNTLAPDLKNVCINGINNPVTFDVLSHAIPDFELCLHFKPESLDPLELDLSQNQHRYRLFDYLIHNIIETMRIKHPLCTSPIQSNFNALLP